MAGTGHDQGRRAFIHTNGNLSGPVTRLRLGQNLLALVDGPLSFDVAVDMTAARVKGIEASPVAGQADALVAPSIETANGVYRAMCLFGKAEMAGILYGGIVPIVLPSRSDSAENRFNSIALAAMAAKRDSLTD